MSGQAVASLIAAGRQIADKRLTWGASGNVSVRAGDSEAYVTASGSRLGALQPSDVIHTASGAGRPSKEWPMHRAIYAARADVGAICHASPFYTTLLAATQPSEPLQEAIFVEALPLAGRVAAIGWYPPGSAELARAVGEAAREADVILLQNHGVVCCAENIQKAVDITEIFEMVCKMNLLAALGGRRLISLANGEADGLAANYFT